MRLPEIAAKAGCVADSFELELRRSITSTLSIRNQCYRLSAIRSDF